MRYDNDIAVKEDCDVMRKLLKEIKGTSKNPL